MRKQLGKRNSRSDKGGRGKSGGVGGGDEGAGGGLTERLVGSRLRWAGRMERIADDRLPKRAAELHEGG